MTQTISSTAAQLPARFKALESQIERWAAPGEQERRELRATSSMLELAAFYAAVGPEMTAIGEHLDQFPMGETLPVAELQLLRIAQMYMEAAWAVEIVGSPEEAGQVPRERWKIVPVAGQQFSVAAATASMGASNVGE